MRVSAISEVLDKFGDDTDDLELEAAARAELARLQKHASIARQAINALGLVHAVLFQCHYFRGYQGGPAHMPGVKRILAQSESALKDGDNALD